MIYPSRAMFLISKKVTFFYRQLCYKSRRNLNSGEYEAENYVMEEGTSGSGSGRSGSPGA